MNRKQSRWFLVLMFLFYQATLVSSCKKEKEVENAKTKTELLTGGAWKLTAAIITPAYDYYGDGNAVSDVFAILKPCEKDDFEIYKTDGMWEYHEGPSKCDPSSPQVFNLPWRWSDNETKLFVGPVEQTILELGQSTLKVRYQFEEAGIIYTEEDTYFH